MCPVYRLRVQTAAAKEIGGEKEIEHFNPLPAIIENWLSTTHLSISKGLLTHCFLLAGNDFKAHRVER